MAPERATENRLELDWIFITLFPGKLISFALEPLERVIWLGDVVPYTRASVPAMMLRFGDVLVKITVVFVRTPAV